VPAQFSYPQPSKKGDETFALQQVQEAVFVTITIRYRPSTNISPAYRVLYGSGVNQRIFNIRSVFVDDENRRIIIMQCQELQAKGTLHQ
jgi:head-tail adaptor